MIWIERNVAGEKNIERGWTGLCAQSAPSRRGEGGRASRSFPQEYPTNSIEVACVSSTNQVSLYLNACGNKRHVRIGTVRGLARVKFPFSLLSYPPIVPFRRFSSPFSHPSPPSERIYMARWSNVSSSNYEHVLEITSDAFLFLELTERKR